MDTSHVFHITLLFYGWFRLRDRLAEPVALKKFMPMLYRDFALNRDSKYGENEDVQFEFVATLLHIVDRRPPFLMWMNEIDHQFGDGCEAPRTGEYRFDSRECLSS